MMFDHRHSTPLNSTPYRPWSSVPVLLQKRSVCARAGPWLLTIAWDRRFSGSQSTHTITARGSKARSLLPYWSCAGASWHQTSGECKSSRAFMGRHRKAQDLRLKYVSTKMGLPLEKYATILHIV